jgi:hypothetical protein
MSIWVLIGVSACVTNPPPPVPNGINTQPTHDLKPTPTPTQNPTSSTVIGADKSPDGMPKTNAICSNLGEIRKNKTTWCRCEVPHYCGGAKPSNELLQRLANSKLWLCHGLPPAGCPEIWDPAMLGKPCADEGITCSLYSCCRDAVQCVEQKWVERPGACPP